MHRFYVELNLFSGEIIELPLSVTHHINVLRIKKNSIIKLFNGQNNKEFLAKLIEINKRNSLVKIEEAIDKVILSKLNIKLAISLIAKDKMDIVIQKACELGVREVIPIITKFSFCYKKFNLEHFKKIIINSSEQCGRNSLLEIHLPISFESFLNKFNSVKHKLFCSLIKPENNLNQSSFSEILLCIGPEGGFSEEETINLKKNNFKPLYLGENILRSETAAIAAVSSIKTLENEFFY